MTGSSTRLAIEAIIARSRKQRGLYCLVRLRGRFSRRLTRRTYSWHGNSEAGSVPGKRKVNVLFSPCTLTMHMFPQKAQVSTL